jgi:hypothetical protein
VVVVAEVVLVLLDFQCRGFLGLGLDLLKRRRIVAPLLRLIPLLFSFLYQR